MELQEHIPTTLYRLPIEIIAEIFFFANVHTAAISLAHITHRLRQIALTTCLLWRNIRLTDSGDIPRPPWCGFTAPRPLALPRPRSFHKLIFHLKHSGTAPLDLYLFFGDYDDSSVVACHVFRIIQPHLHRVRHFQIVDEIFNFEVPLGSFQFLNFAAPMLRTLDLYSELGDSIPTEFLAASFPRLESVTLRGAVGRLLSPWLLTLPRQLTELHLLFGLFESLGLGEEANSKLTARFDPIMRIYSPSLVKLTLCAVEIYDLPCHWDSAPLIFPMLETLTIKGCLTFLLPLIVAPILEQFDISSSFTTQVGIPAHYQMMVHNIMVFLTSHARTLVSATISLYRATHGQPRIIPYPLDNPLLCTTFPRLTSFSARVGVGLTAIAAHMNMPNLAELSIDIVEEMPIHWAALGLILLGCQQSLSKLDVRWSGAPESKWMVGDFEGLPPILLPHLQELVLLRLPRVHLLTRRLKSTLSLRVMVLNGTGDVRIVVVVTYCMAI